MYSGKKFPLYTTTLGKLLLCTIPNYEIYPIYLGSSNRPRCIVYKHSFEILTRRTLTGDCQLRLRVLHYSK